MNTTNPPLPPTLLALASSYIKHAGTHDQVDTVAENLAHALNDTALVLQDPDLDKVRAVTVTVTPILDPDEGEKYARQLARIIDDELDDLLTRRAAKSH